MWDVTFEVRCLLSWERRFFWKKFKGRGAWAKGLRTKIVAPSQSPTLRVNQTFITWVSVAYVTSITATSGQYNRGSGAKPNAAPAQVKGKLIPTPGPTRRPGDESEERGCGRGEDIVMCCMS